MAEGSGTTHHHYTLGEKLNALSLMDWLKIGGVTFALAASAVAYYYGVRDSIAQNQRNHATVLLEIASIRSDVSEVAQAGRDQDLEIRDRINQISAAAEMERDKIDGRLNAVEIAAIKDDITKAQIEQELQQLTKQIEALNNFMARGDG